MMDRRLKWALIIAGLGYTAYRLYNRPKKVGVFKGGGRTLTHYQGPISIHDRLQLIEKMVATSVKDPVVRQAAMDAVRHCPSHDKQCEIKGVYDYVRKNVRYTGDIAPVLQSNGRYEPIDVYTTAGVTLGKYKGGDCDDHTIVERALLANLGIPSFSRAAKYKAMSPFEHVYAMAEWPKNNYIALDTTLKNSPRLGKELPYYQVLDFPK